MVVEPHRGGPEAVDDLVGEPARLSANSVPELGAGRDMPERMLRLVAREHTIGELQRLRACQGRGQQAVELAAGGEFGDNALEDAVATVRVSALLVARTG